MRITVYFTHLDRSEAVEASVREGLEGVLEKHWTVASDHAEVWLSMDKPYQHAGVESYTCEFLIHSKQFGNLVLKKDSDNLYKSTNACLEALERRLSRLHKKRVSQTHRTPNIGELVESV